MPKQSKYLICIFKTTKHKNAINISLNIFYTTIDLLVNSYNTYLKLFGELPNLYQVFKISFKKVNWMKINNELSICFYIIKFNILVHTLYTFAFSTSKLSNLYSNRT